MYALLALSILVLSQNANAAPQTETAQPPKTGDPAEYDLALVLDLAPELPQEWRSELEKEAKTTAQRERIKLTVVPTDSKELTLIGGCRVLNATCSQAVMELTKASMLLLMQIQVNNSTAVAGCDIVSRNGVVSKPPVSISDRGGLGLEEAKQFLRGVIVVEAHKLKGDGKPPVVMNAWESKPVLPDPTKGKKAEQSPSPLKKLLWPMAFIGGLAIGAGILALAVAALAYGAAWAVNVSTAVPMPNETQRKYYDRREGSANLIGSMMLGTVVGAVIGMGTLVIGLAAAGSAGGIYLVP